MTTDRFSEFTSIDKAYKHSAKILNLLREEFSAALSESPYKEKITIVTTGSFGRGEASEESDLDLFIFFDSDKPEDTLQDEKSSIQAIVDKYIKKPAGDTGTFGSEAVIKFNEMLQNLGGDKDSNLLLTRRMLFLLEGKWLYGEDRFNEYRTDLLNRYIKAGDPERQISRFLLNDIIRYYRTITTDFEFKVTENSKSWGLRNVKLRFSRKLLYFGGVLAIAETVFDVQTEKNELISKILDKTVLERVQDIGDKNPHTPEILGIYQDFLQTIESPKNREILESVKKETRAECALFLEMREKSKRFSKILDDWLKVQYPEKDGAAHPIHNALIF